MVERALVYPWVGAVLGSWISIIPIALDWDRPWQVRCILAMTQGTHIHVAVGVASDTSVRCINWLHSLFGYSCHCRSYLPESYRLYLNLLVHHF